jgi:GTP:adenosylcobinamide-phosphate guanylyltransferase
MSAAIPDYVQHADKVVDRVLLGAWLVTQDEPIGYLVARAALPTLTPRIVGQIVDEIADEFRSVQFCQDDPEAYAFHERISQPHGVTWVQWSEAECDALVERATALAVNLTEHGRLAVSA